MICYGLDGYFVVLVGGGFHGGADIGFFVVVFSKDARGGWC